jgi:hypothetical protein
MSRRLRKLEGRIRKLESPAEQLDLQRISERLDECRRLQQQLIPVSVYANGRLERIEYETRDDLEAAARQGEKTA